jgi:hypothetical protein
MHRQALSSRNSRHVPGHIGRIRRELGPHPPRVSPYPRNPADLGQLPPTRRNSRCARRHLSGIPRAARRPSRNMRWIGSSPRCSRCSSCWIRAACFGFRAAVTAPPRNRPPAGCDSRWPRRISRWTGRQSGWMPGSSAGSGWDRSCISRHPGRIRRLCRWIGHNPRWSGATYAGSVATHAPSHIRWVLGSHAGFGVVMPDFGAGWYFRREAGCIRRTVRCIRSNPLHPGHSTPDWGGFRPVWRSSLPIWRRCGSVAGNPHSGPRLLAFISPTPGDNAKWNHSRAPRADSGAAVPACPNPILIRHNSRRICGNVQSGRHGPCRVSCN